MAGADDIKRPDEEAPDSEPEPQSIRGDAVAQVMNEVNGPNGPLQVIANADEYPNAPEKGFSGSEDYAPFIGKMNDKAVKDFAEFKAHPEKYRMRDPENPEKFVTTTIHTCADGRCNPALYSDPSNPLQHLNLDWQPAAGLIYFPEVTVSPTCDGIEGQLDSNPSLKAKIYTRLQKMYGPAIEQFLKEYRVGTTSRHFIEQQSHWNKDHYHSEHKHGCGAHNHKLVDAQKETIKNSVIVEKWLKECYPEQFQKGLFKIFRTIQDNSVAEEGQDSSDKNHVYDSAHIDSTLTGDEKGDFAGLFDEVKGRFAPPSVQDPEKHIVRPYTGNPFNIDPAEHNEQGIRVSRFQWANTLNGQSAMEITWNDGDIIAQHNTVLLRIIGDNKFSKANPDKPHYIHLDLEKGDSGNREDYNNLMKKMDKDASLKARLKAGNLFLFVTETDRETMKTHKLA